VQLALAGILTPNVSDDTLIQIVTYLWFIWKARNELRFQKHKWSILQVHNSVHAHISMHLKELKKEPNRLVESANARQQVNSHTADGAQAQAHGTDENYSQEPTCSTDASITPDA